MYFSNRVRAEFSPNRLRLDISRVRASAVACASLTIEETLALYGVADALKFWTTKEHLIIQWERSSEEPEDDWVEGEGWMTPTHCHS